MKRFVLFCLLAWTGVLNATPEPTVVRFGTVPTESSMNLRRDMEPLREALEKAIGRKVELFFASDYTSVIEAMRFKRLDVCNFGNQSAIDAVDRANGEVFAQILDKDGNPGYWSVIVVREDSTIDSLATLLARRKESTLGLGDPQSTSGNLVPSYYAFGANGVNPNRDFKAVRMANHEANLLAVANGQVDACAASNEALFRLEHSQPKMAKRLRVIWTSPMIASDPIVLRRDLPADLKNQIREFFTTFGRTEEERAKIEPLKWSGFRTSSNDQLLPYRMLRIEGEKRKIEADPALPQARRAELLADLDRRQQELKQQMTRVADTAPAGAEVGVP